MINLTINGQNIEVKEETTLLQAAEKLNIKILTLCNYKALIPYGACRLCLVEVGEGDKAKIQTACTYPSTEGLIVKTDTERVIKTRKIIAELLLARCPEVKVVQEIAEELGVKTARFKKKDSDCILCGLCVRICKERMGPTAISFTNRGITRAVKTPYGMPSEVCQVCGACGFICPTGRIKLSEYSDKLPQLIPYEHNTGLIDRPAVYIPYPQAIPNKATIDGRFCVHLLRGACEICKDLCEAKAIDYEEKEKEIDINVGAVIFSPGYELFDANLKKELGYDRYPNVITSIEFERILSASGPFLGQILKPSDNSHPKKIAFIQCVGSRDTEHDYCSSICCMYATKEAIIAKEHAPELDCSIFFIDIRAFGKGFEEYYERAKKLGVRYIRCRPSSIKENYKTKNLKIQYQLENGDIKIEEFDLVILSTGVCPPNSAEDIKERFGIKLNKHKFCETSVLKPVNSNKDGVFVAGPFVEPKDIPETVMQSSAAAVKVMSLLAEAKNTLIAKKEFPEEIDVSDQPPRIGVFVCHCGTNIAGVVNVSSCVEYAKTLPNVVYAENNLYTCSNDAQEKIKHLIKENNLTRVVVASCSPRTHEPLFRNTCREAGLNPYLFEMANIRDQCSWAHMHEQEAATRKAKDLIRIAVAKAQLLEPLQKKSVGINKSALVIGAGISGMNAALELANQDFTVHLVEQEKDVGGNFRKLHFLLNGDNPEMYLKSLTNKVLNHEKIYLYTNSKISSIEGFIGNFKTTLQVTKSQSHKDTEELANGEWRMANDKGTKIVDCGVRNAECKEEINPKSEIRNPKFPNNQQLTTNNILPSVNGQSAFAEIEHGIVIVATGAQEYKPTEYLYGQDERIITQLELEEKLSLPHFLTPSLLHSIVMIQCVGSRDENRPYCSRICCQEAIKNALKIKELNPQANIYILYRDIRTYGFKESYYTKARDKGIIFLRYDEDKKPEVKIEKREESTKTQTSSIVDGLSSIDSKPTTINYYQTGMSDLPSTNNQNNSESRITISVFDPVLNLPVSIEADLLVLSVATIAPPQNKEIAQVLKVPLNQDNFFLEAHMKLRPVDFATDGVFLCGLAHSPKLVDESIIQSYAAAARASTVLSKDLLELEATISYVVDENCDGCAYCIDVCPYKALTLIEYTRDGLIKKTVEVNETACKGCGTCMATCPKKGIFVKGFKLEQISAQVEAALQPVEY